MFFKKLFYTLFLDVDYRRLKITNIGFYSIAKSNVSIRTCKIIKKILKTVKITCFNKCRWYEFAHFF